MYLILSDCTMPRIHCCVESKGEKLSPYVVVSIILLVQFQKISAFVQYSDVSHCNVKMFRFTQYMRNEGVIIYILYFYGISLFPQYCCCVAVMSVYNIKSLQNGSQQHNTISYCTDLQSGTLLYDRETLRSGLIQIIKSYSLQI